MVSKYSVRAISECFLFKANAPAGGSRETSQQQEAVRYVESQRLLDASHTTSWCGAVVNSLGSYLEFIRRREAQSRKRMKKRKEEGGGVDTKIVSVRRLRER